MQSSPFKLQSGWIEERNERERLNSRENWVPEGTRGKVMGENMEEEISSMEKHHNSCATQQKQLHHLFPSPLLIKNQREINPTKI